VVAHAVLGNAGQGVVEGVEVPGLRLSVLLERRSRDQHVPRLAQPGIVDLEDEAGIDDGPVLGLEGLGDREHVGVLGRIVAILAAADHGRRDGGHEGLGDAEALQGRLECGEVLLQ
jgi:hypothetical protein